MRLKLCLLWICLILLLWDALLLASTWGAFNGITVGGSSGNISSWNGVTIGGASGNVNAWNGLTAPAGCTNARETINGTQHGTQTIDWGRYSGTKYQAVSFAASASYTVCAADIYVYKVGSPSQTGTIQIWSDSAGLPSSIIGTSSDAIAFSTFSTSEAVVQFVNISAAVTSSTTYWIVYVASATDSSNYGEMIFRDITGHNQVGSADGTSWGTLYTNYGFHIVVYSQ